MAALKLFLTLDLEPSPWKRAAFRALALRACTAALEAERVSGHAEIGLLVTDDARMRTLNHDFRGHDKPTNVLAFPASRHPEPQAKDLRHPPGILRFAQDDSSYLGDIALSAETVTLEALAQGKPVEAHCAHLLVHATLHLLGHNHERAQEAACMEAKEISILQELGIANPYL